jgi:starch synthase
MNDVILSHSGKQHAYKTATALLEIGRLRKFITSSYFDPSRIPDKWLWRNERVRRYLQKRYEPRLHGTVLRNLTFELPEVAIRKLFGNNRIASDAVCYRDALFDRSTAAFQIHGARIFWGFQGSCLQSLRRARSRGITAILEFATAHVPTAVRILSEESLMNPEWADSISNLSFPGWYLRRLEEEPASSDYCVAASGFTKRSLEASGVPSDKIQLLPLGADLEKFRFTRRPSSGPFQILFVGGVGQRKGIKYLLDAYERVRSAHTRLKIIGPIMGSGKAFRSRSSLYEYLGILSQDEVVRYMQESHVLVLPSLLEGFGLVIPEAMATGMPVIASDHSAAPEIIREGVDGFVLKPDDVDGLAEKLESLMADRKRSADLGRNASERAEEYSWQKYQDRLKIFLGYVDKFDMQRGPV